MSKLLLLSSAAIIMFASPAFAQDAAPQDSDYHEEPSAEIVVTAPFSQDASKRLAGTTILTGEDLTREIRTTIGDTLAKQPGVSSTSFGPNASRPVLRGFQGERVRILTDGIGSIDVSNTSVDHAVIINPLTAERIEVLRGPSALLFGSSAIGGVVNVLSNRIPRKVPDEAVHVSALGTYGSAANERSGTASIDVPLASKFVVHFDGSYAKTGDLRTGGFLLTPALRTQALASADPAIRDLAALKGRLPNSAAKTWEVAGGAAYVNDNGSIGFSVSHYDSLYGLPIRYSLTPGVEAEAVRLDVQQTREDLRAETTLGGSFLDKIKFRAGHANYKHNEIDETGAIGTTFLNDSIEARLELVQAERSGWKGASGFQMSIRDFNIIGDEAFIPKNTTSQYGVFTLQEVNVGNIKFEGGARFEHTAINADPSATIGNPAYALTFNAVSGSFGASYALSDGIRLGLNAAYTQRAPSAEELFPNGPHAGTQAFEIGDPTFKKEISKGLEATLNGKGDGYSFGASLYYTKFDNYIYETQTGAVIDDLPVFQFLQGEADYYGFEVEGSARLATIGSFTINADALADMVRAKVKSFGPAPRIPPLRVLGGLELQSDSVQARVEAEWTDNQTRVTGFETPTKGFTLVNASLSFKPFGKDNGTSILLSANNIFDVEARRHASFLKDFAPLSGRDLRVTAKVAF
jgi:iron complex outermembrane recepter protein